MVQIEYGNSRRSQWTPPRPRNDPSERLRTYGRIQPMEHRRGLIEWLLGR